MSRECIKCKCNLENQSFTLIQYQYKRNSRWVDSGHGVCDHCEGSVTKFRFKLWLGESLNEK